MVGPHWNQNYAEVSIGLHGKGIVRVVCPTLSNETLCKDQRFKVEEGDVFVVPRYHAMTQISYNNDSFVFVGFTMTSKKNHPRNLAGKSSIIQILDKLVLGKSFNASKIIIDQIYSAQQGFYLFECTSCAEEEEKLMEEEEEEGEKEGEGWGGHEKEREGETTRKGREEEELGREGEGGREWKRQEKGSEGEIARKEEEELERRRIEAEESATRGRGEEEKGGRGGGRY